MPSFSPISVAAISALPSDAPAGTLPSPLGITRLGTTDERRRISGIEGIVDLNRGWTKSIKMPLERDPGTGFIAVNLTDCDVALVLKLNGSTDVTTTGDLEVYDAVNGIVIWTPDTAELGEAGKTVEYTMHVKVTDSEGDSYFPNGRPVAVRVFEQ